MQGNRGEGELIFLSFGFVFQVESKERKETVKGRFRFRRKNQSIGKVVHSHSSFVFPSALPRERTDFFFLSACFTLLWKSEISLIHKELRLTVHSHSSLVSSFLSYRRVSSSKKEKGVGWVSSERRKKRTERKEKIKNSSTRVTSGSFILSCFRLSLQFKKK